MYISPSLPKNPTSNERKREVLKKPRQLLLSLKSRQFQFETQMSSNNDDINVLNVWAHKESR